MPPETKLFREVLYWSSTYLGHLVVLLNRVHPLVSFLDVAALEFERLGVVSQQQAELVLVDFLHSEPHVVEVDAPFELRVRIFVFKVEELELFQFAIFLLLKFKIPANPQSESDFSCGGLPTYLGARFICDG